MAVGTYSLVENNHIEAALTITAGCNVTGNTVKGLTISGADANVYGNTINGAVTISGANVEFTDNVVVGAVTVNSNGNQLNGNNITSTGDYAITVNSARTGNEIIANYLIAKDKIGDEAVSYTSDNVVINNFPAALNLTVTAVDIKVGEDAIINITAHEMFRNEVTVLVNGEEQTVFLMDGIGSLTVSDLPAANYTVVVSFEGNDYFFADEVNTTFEVSKYATEFTITTGDVVVEEDVEVTVSLPGVTGEVTIISDVYQGTVQLTDGTGTFTIPKVVAGDHYIIAVFEGNDEYEPAVSETYNFTVEKEEEYEFDVNITVEEIDYGETVTLNVTLPEDANGQVTVTVNGEPAAFEDVVNGTATVTVPASAFETGYNDIEVTYSDDKYGETTVEKEIHVNYLPVDLTASADDIELGQNATIVISLPDDIDGDVYVELQGVYYEVIDGKVIIENLTEGTYTAYVSIEDDSVYMDNETEVTFTVSKVKKSADEAFNMTTPENATSPVVELNLPEDATGYLLVDVDGNQTFVPVKNGKATAEMPKLNPGNYTATITYTGDNKYDPITTTKDITVESNVPDNALTIPETSSTDSPTYSINLSSDATGYLEVDVDGKKYLAPLENGTASVTVPGLSNGDHNVTVTYSGDDKYSKVSKSTTLNVNASSATPVYAIAQNKDVSALYSAAASYKVLVTKDGKAVGAGESVTFNFNGKNTVVKTDANGYATLMLNTKVKVKTYTVTAEYNGVKVSNKVKVTHVIKASNKKVKKSKKVTKVKVTLKKVNGKVLKSKKITIKFKGKKYKVKTNKKGVATWKVKKSMLKKLKVGKKYKYTVTYGKDVVNKKLTIKK